MNNALAMHIIQVPSVFTCKLPGGEWLNLAQIRSLEIEDNPLTVLVTWSSGGHQVYRGVQAFALIEAWAEAKGVDKSHIEEVP